MLSTLESKSTAAKLVNFAEQMVELLKQPGVAFADPKTNDSFIIAASGISHCHKDFLAFFIDLLNNGISPRDVISILNLSGDKHSVGYNLVETFDDDKKDYTNLLNALVAKGLSFIQLYDYLEKNGIAYRFDGDLYYHSYIRQLFLRSLIKSMPNDPDYAELCKLCDSSVISKVHNVEDFILSLSDPTEKRRALECALNSEHPLAKAYFTHSYSLFSITPYNPEKLKYVLAKLSETPAAPKTDTEIKSDRPVTKTDFHRVLFKTLCLSIDGKKHFWLYLGCHTAEYAESAMRLLHDFYRAGVASSEEIYYLLKIQADHNGFHLGHLLISSKMESAFEIYRNLLNDLCNDPKNGYTTKEIFSLLTIKMHDNETMSTLVVKSDNQNIAKIYLQILENLLFKGLDPYQLYHHLEVSMKNSSPLFLALNDELSKLTTSAYQGSSVLFSATANEADDDVAEQARPKTGLTRRKVMGCRD